MLLSVIAVTSFILAAQPPAPPLLPQFGQSRDPRQRLPEATGTAVIRGRVVNTDGHPVKRVVVTLNQTNVDTEFNPANAPTTRPISRTVMTDAQGQFQFEHLPAGFYRLSARPDQFQAQYLMGAYGQKRPDNLGPPFEVADGQMLSGATIVMPRSGVITGRVTDDEGEPIARAPVSVLFFPPGSASPVRNGGAQTDDLGRFRLFGLQPGDYAVFADVRNGNNFGVESDTDPTGFTTTYYPGVASEAEAQRVQVRSGAETSGVDFRLIRGRLFTVSGTVINSQGQPLSPINVMVMRSLGGPGENVVNGFSTDGQGHFTLRGLTPGDYKLVVRPRIAPQGAMIMNGRQMPDMAEFANFDLHVDSDMTDVVITTRPTLSIAGRVMFAEGLPPAVPGSPDPVRSLRVSAATPPGPGAFGPPSNAEVASDLSFTLKGLSSSAIVRINGLPRNFVLKQVLVGTEDITDRPHEFVDRDSGELQIVLTSRVSGVSGTAVDGSGKPAVDAVVLLLLEPQQGRSGLYRTGSVDPRGRFQIPALRSGSFVVLAVPRDRMPRVNNPDAYDALAKEGQPIAIGDGEFKVIDLKLSGGG